MSYAQFGYPYHPASQILVSSQTSGNAMPPNPCCESGRVVTDPVTSQTVFSCQQCDTHSLVYPRLGSSVPTTPYPPYGPEQSYSTVGMGVETPTAFYPSIVPGSLYSVDKGSNDVAGSWQSMQSPGYYSYDPASLSYSYGYDVNGARRKNATREATATLKAWLNDHRKNPYPTKGEKIMLAIITKMTLTQVSTWFANARRRLKKENKMTWEPKGKEDEEDDDDGKGSDDDDDTKDSPGINDNINNIKIEVGSDGPKEHLRDGLVNSTCLPLPPTLHMTHNTLGHNQRLNGPCDSMSTSSNHSLQSHHSMPNHHPALHPTAHHHPHLLQQQQLPRYPSHPMDLQQHEQERMKMQQHCDMIGMGGSGDEESGMTRSNSPSSMSQNKPKIWSLADTATCKTPPTASLVPLGQRNPRSLGPSSMAVNRSSDGQWPPSAVYQRPISSYQSSQNAPPTVNYVNAYHQQQQPPNSGASSVPLALLVHDKNQAASATAAVNPQHGVILNQTPSSACDVITSSPTAAGSVSAIAANSVIATTSNNVMRTPIINQCSNNPFNELQTDTPPQTPPNHKFPLTSNGAASASNVYATRLGHTPNASSHVGPQNSAYNSVDNIMYNNQRALISRLPEFQDDNAEHVSINFSANNNGQAVSHVNSLNNNTDNSNSNSGNSMDETAFKPVFKSSLSNNGNLVIA